MAELEIKNLHKKFGKTKVLKGIDFSLEKGEVVSIIGSSGSGKTTLLRCINFLEIADEGEIKVDGNTIFKSGENITSKKMQEMQLLFGMVFQNFNLFPQYTVLENIMLAPKLHAKQKYKNDFKMKKEAVENIRQQALTLLERVGLTDKKDNYPCQLSGGQQQRVAIARALALNPKILCFDEPTSALDPELTGEVLNVIRGLKNSDTTMIVVTHEMEFAKEVSDKIIFMADGIIAEEGTPSQLMDNPKTERLINFLQK
ncbi:MAG: amino acid ABC transporter ATP-binding protein [Clostridia bacterium]|nr:amino acid ABC transporter ATP-binding protein [Clostridia bacterium]